MAKNTNKIYAEALYSVLEDKEDIRPTVSAFLNFLKEKSELHKIDKILKEFEKIYNVKQNIAELNIKSAFPLKKNTIQNIAKALGIDKYEVATEIDHELIGGFIAKYNDNLIDISFKNSLDNLYNKLIK